MTHWCPDIGFHGNTEPTREQMHERMRARYGGRR